MQSKASGARIAQFLTPACLLACLLITTLFTLSPVQAGDLTIAAAADLNFAFKELVPTFEQQTGEHVKLTLGSSGNFYAQIQNGAPFDLYFSADIGYPRKLEEAGLVMPGSLYPYAVGRIVLWTGNESPTRSVSFITGTGRVTSRHLSKAS